MRRALVLAAVLLGAAAPPASAGGMNGLLVSNVDFNCSSLTTGSPYVEPMISGIVGWDSVDEIPKGGEVFSANLSIGVVGRPCSGAEVVPTIIPPVGVRLAIDAKHPLQWRYPGTDGAWQTKGYKLLPLADGSTKIAVDGERSLWPIATDQPPLQFRFPLVAERALSGRGSEPGQCPNGPPCAASEAGDYLQVRIDTSIGTPLVITPVVSLFATAPPPPAATKLSAPGKDLKVKVQAAKGAKLELRLTAKRKVLARGSATARRDGTTTVALKRTAAGRRVKGTVKATLTLTASGTDLMTVERSASVKVRG
jgi:hypothetical protein